MKRTILMIIFMAWILIPTGTPDDILTFYLIKNLGFQLYTVLLLILFVLMLHYKINFDKIKKAIKGLLKCKK